MGGVGASLDVATSTSGLFEVIEAQHGAGVHRFLDWEGRTVPW